jgi:hypothetical protein
MEKIHIKIACFGDFIIKILTRSIKIGNIVERCTPIATIDQRIAHAYSFFVMCEIASMAMAHPKPFRIPFDANPQKEKAEMIKRKAMKTFSGSNFFTASAWVKVYPRAMIRKYISAGQ